MEYHSFALGLNFVSYIFPCPQLAQRRVHLDEIQVSQGLLNGTPNALVFEQHLGSLIQGLFSVPLNIRGHSFLNTAFSTLSRSLSYSESIISLMKYREDHLDVAAAERWEDVAAIDGLDGAPPVHSA